MVIAIDIGGTFIKIGLIKNGQIIDKQSIKAYPEIGFEKTMLFINNSVTDLLNKCSISVEEISGIGIGFPGIVDSDKMKVLSTNKKYQDAIKFDFIKWARDCYNVPIVLENDARLALLGEWQYGAAKGIDSAVMLTLGTGVGSAAIIEGEILRGKHYQAGCLGGHFTVKVNGAECTCGNVGCVEAEASTWRLPELLKSDKRYQDSMIKGEKLDFESIFKLAAKGAKLSLAVRNECLEIWSAATINMIHAYDPEIVIIGGGIMKSADVILPFIKNKVEKHAWVSWGEIEIVASEIPNKSALLGAYYLVTKNQKTNE